MDVIPVLLIVSLMLLVGPMAFVVNFKHLFHITYIAWSRPKKWVFSIVIGASPWFFLDGPWVYLSIFFVFQNLMIFEKQKYFISIKWRS